MRILALAGLTLLLAACGTDAPPAEEETSVQTDVTFDAEIAGDEVSSLVTTSGEFRMGLTDQVLYFQLTDAVASEVEKDLEESESEGGLGGRIAGAVSNAVVSAMTTPIQIPLADVRDVRFENGELKIEMEDENADVNLSFDNENTDPQYDPEEARQFVAAFQELKGR